MTVLGPYDRPCINCTRVVNIGDFDTDYESEYFDGNVGPFCKKCYGCVIATVQEMLGV